MTNHYSLTARSCVWRLPWSDEGGGDPGAVGGRNLGRKTPVMRVSQSPEGP